MEKIGGSLILLLVSIALLLSGCEEVFNPDTGIFEKQVVVEGAIMEGPGAPPPYVILTYSVPFYDTFDLEALESLFVKNADVSVTVEDGLTYPLSMICLAQLPAEIRRQILEEFGISIFAGSAEGICIYIDLAREIPVRIGNSYQLEILVDGEYLTATISIPEHIPLTSFRFDSIPGDDPIDTLARLLPTISDPGGEENFYQYYISENSGPFRKSFSSVTDDAFFDGQTFEFQLDNIRQLEANEGEEEDNEDLDLAGFYKVGDTIVVRWITMDEESFEFWNSLEFSRSNQGPFSSYTRVKGNIEGGLGGWTGYSYSEYELVVQLP